MSCQLTVLPPKMIKIYKTIISLLNPLHTAARLTLGALPTEPQEVRESTFFLFHIVEEFKRMIQIQLNDATTTVTCKLYSLFTALFPHPKVTPGICHTWREISTNRSSCHLSAPINWPPPVAVAQSTTRHSGEHISSHGSVQSQKTEVSQDLQS